MVSVISGADYGHVRFCLGSMAGLVQEVRQVVHDAVYEQNSLSSELNSGSSEHGELD